jgi:hypothetical protein
VREGKQKKRITNSERLSEKKIRKRNNGGKTFGKVNSLSTSMNQLIIKE